MPKTIAINPKKKPTTRKTASDKVWEEHSFPIVAIGASSGGLEAVTELFKYLPADTGMAYIFVQHLNPNYKSILASLLVKSTKMKVQVIEDMELMKPNNVYVIPYNKGIEVINGHIKLLAREKSIATNLSIDVLFTSLAETHKENAIGIVLSGNASDGTQGLKAIKQEGGITFAQDISAKYGSMPQSAINEGAADFILSPKQIALELSRIGKHTFERKKVLKVEGATEIDDNSTDLKFIVELLHKETGVDFNHYKMGTIKRRIQRRMFLNKIFTIGQYIKLLKTNSHETDVLYNDLLINVTAFFRDTTAFQHLKSTVLPKLLKNKVPSEKLRIWVTACSTGQEAYSMAMLVIEIMGKKFSGKHVQIFASDLSEPAIKKARLGEYSKPEVEGVSAKRLERFFTKTDGTYRISKQVRDICAFAPHNILGDPPFSKIDLISCCNLLIYLDVATHKKVLTTFHYALNDGGCLMLGKAETVSTSPLYVQPNNKFKIYTRKKGIRTLPDLSSRGMRPNTDKKTPPLVKKIIAVNPAAIEASIGSILFSRYLPTYVVINHAMEILQFKGATGMYLEHATGKATFNILTMARPEIAFELREAINKAIKTQKEINKGGIEIKMEGALYTITLDIIPITPHAEDPLLLVIFTKNQQPEKHVYKNGKNGVAGNSSNIDKMRAEIIALRAELIALGEEKEKSNRILQEANEEVLTSNEEFQSMNEEMETSKEETECANEELITTNQELQMRNEQLAEANDLSEAIVATMHEPMLILDKDLRIKSSNESFYKKFKVLKGDIAGKLLFELGNRQWDIPSLRELLENIIQKDTYFYDYEITHEFEEIGKRTMLLNAMRVVQQVQNEQLILLAFTDTTDKTRERKAEKKGLEDIIGERTKALEESYAILEDKNLTLQKVNKELETFTFISSHDLQEPLRKIRTFSSMMLKEQDTLSATGKDYLQRMQEAVVRMQRLIEDLVSYARVQNVKNFEKIDLNKIAKDVIAEFNETLKEKKGIVKTDGLCKVNVIRFQIRQVLQNLISNSVKFSAPKRPLRITIKNEIVAASEIQNNGFLPDVKYCHMTYTDNGIGFDPKYNNRIFEVFQRLHDYETYKGTGMGLAICKRIVERHNGIITATGTLNKGARFDIYIPAA